MIFRKNNISPSADEVVFTVSFSSYDIWTWLHRRCWMLHRDHAEDYSFATSRQFAKSDLVFELTNDPLCLGWMPKKRATPIAEWAITKAVTKGYLHQSQDGCYYSFAPSMVKKNGRPKES